MGWKTVRITRYMYSNAVMVLYTISLMKVMEPFYDNMIQYSAV